YPASAYPTPRAAYVRLTTDSRFVCPSREIADGADAAQGPPVFRYFFQHRPSALGAVHGLDVPYVFGTFGAIITPGGQPYQPTATDLALLHMQTERLDHAMGLAWVHLPPTPADAARYVAAWRGVGERAEREQQLASVMKLGQDLTRFTRMPGLRMMLRMMRKPAQAAGLGALQHFLETGFDTFGEMARRRGAVEHFLSTVHEREATLMQALFDGDPVACGTQLEATLGLAR
ncbi:MAG TPA: carboxylesterase family protein, partial [Giesbergeria sp.]|nr:carboxylesterase family protein [Giesbergeria sp.]